MIRTNRSPAGRATLAGLAALALPAIAAAAPPAVTPNHLADSLPKALPDGLERQTVHAGYRHGTAGAEARYTTPGRGELTLKLVRARTASERFHWRATFRLRMKGRMAAATVDGHRLYRTTRGRPMAAVLIGDQITVLAQGHDLEPATVVSAVRALDYGRLDMLAEAGEADPAPPPTIDPERLAALLPASAGKLKRAGVRAAVDDGLAMAMARYGTGKASLQMRLADYRGSRGRLAARLEGLVAKGRAAKGEAAGFTVYRMRRGGRNWLVAVPADYRYGLHVVGRGVDDGALMTALAGIDRAALDAAMPPAQAGRTYRADLSGGAALAIRVPRGWFLIEKGGRRTPFRTIVVSRRPVSPARLASAGPEAALDKRQAVLVATRLPNGDERPPAAWLAADRFSPPKTVNQPRRLGEPEPVEIGGLSAARLRIRGTDGAGESIVNTHWVLRTGPREVLHVHTLRRADAPGPVKRTLAGLVGSLTVESPIGTDR